MNKEEFDALTTIDGVHGEWYDESVESLSIVINSFDSNFYKVIQDHFDLTLHSVRYMEHSEELQVWLEEA